MEFLLHRIALRLYFAIAVNRSRDLAKPIRLWQLHLSMLPDPGPKKRRRSRIPCCGIFDTSLPETALKNVVVLANFATTAVSINPNFPFTGQWFDLMDNSTYQVNSTTTAISIPPGQFRIFGNKQALLSTDDLTFTSTVTLAPNPTSDYFTLNSDVTRVEIYSLTCQLVKSFTEKYTTDNQFYVNDLNSGIYMVKVSNQNNQNKIMKLVKQ